MATITGTLGDDILPGTPDPDAINGLAGNDSLSGMGGDDLLDGGLGDDWLEGGTGDDVFLLDSAGDQIIEIAGQGYDTAYATSDVVLGADVDLELLVLRGVSVSVQGSSTSNQIVGNGLSNVLYGNGGNDYLRGGLGDDFLLGGAGADFLFGEAGDDTMAGNLGDDVYVVDSTLDRVFELQGEGDDRLFTSVSYKLGATVEIEDVVVTGSGLTFTGSDFANNITTVGHGSFLYGMGGRDTLRGSTGNDFLFGGTGADAMIGGGGDDVYEIENVGDLIQESTGNGNDSAYVGVNYFFDADASVETVVLTNSGITVRGSDLANQMVGTAGGETLDGRSGDDYLQAGSGNDSLFGGSGNDFLDGGSGEDRMLGGAGNDIYLIDSEADEIIDGSGLDYDIAFISTDYALSPNTWLEAAVLTSSGSLFFGSDVGSLILTGTGSTGNIMYGRGGNDIIRGSAGSERLIGGTGFDTLTGGAGADLFFLDGPTANSTDMITDFVVGEDRLALGSDVYGLPSGALDHDRFSVDTAQGNLGQFVYLTTNTTLVWDSNGTDAGGVTPMIIFETPQNLGVSDFLIL